MGNLCFGAGRRDLPETVRAAAIDGFSQRFGLKPAALGVAPGRAEILGNHTDYNEGYILAAAINRYTVIAGCTTDSGTCRVCSEMFPGDVISFNAANPEKQTKKTTWANYVLGVVSELSKMNVQVGSFDAYVSGNVPAGAGVSSSAAVEMATAKLLEQLFPETVGKLDDLTLIKVCKAAENNFVGMGCGILDQYSSGKGRQGQLLFLDCRTLENDYVSLRGAQFVLANTHAPHQLVDGKYNELREMCFQAAAALKKATGNEELTHLRDVDSSTLEKYADRLLPPQLNRAKHIVYEDERVLSSFQALRKGNLEALGQAMSQSHASSRDLFGNSCPELDTMIACAEGIEGFLGGRLMGGGFGGCTINLVKEGCIENFMAELSQRYEKKTKIAPTMLICSPGDGAYNELVM